MIFGGIDLTPYLLVTKVTRPMVPKVRLDETEVPGMDGTHVRATGLEPVEIAVDCNIVGGSLDEVAEARAVLASALSGGEKALVLDDAPERYMLARYMGGAEQGRNAHMPNLTLGFYCADPAAYGQLQGLPYGHVQAPGRLELDNHQRLDRSVRPRRGIVHGRTDRRAGHARRALHSQRRGLARDRRERLLLARRRAADQDERRHRDARMGGEVALGAN